MEILEGPEVVVVGGGIIGVAVGRELALRGREVLLLEAEREFGMHSSSRNSEVIHAGIYYPPGSLKATLCVTGRQALYQYCRAQGVKHRRIGKLIVASGAAQNRKLEQLHDQALANGVNDLEWVDAAKIQQLEPAVVAERGLFSPSTGIVDSGELLASLRRDALDAGALSVRSSPVTAGAIDANGVTLEVGGELPSRIRSRWLVNAAGLAAQEVARSITGIPGHVIPPSYFAKGHYFTLVGRSPFNHLVYPVPEPGGLGIHVTLDLEGAARFGPDVEWVSAADYVFDPSRESSFRKAIRAYYPALRDHDLNPGYVGVRPKIVARGHAAADFVVQGPAHHGLPLVNLFGIESPGLTAALALASHVAELVDNGCDAAHPRV